MTETQSLIQTECSFGEISVLGKFLLNCNSGLEFKIISSNESQSFGLLLHIMLLWRNYTQIIPREILLTDGI